MTVLNKLTVQTHLSIAQANFSFKYCTSRRVHPHSLHPLLQLKHSVLLLMYVYYKQLLKQINSLYTASLLLLGWL